MKRPNARAAFSFWVLCGVGVILLVLAALQYRWITQVSRAEQERLKENLRLAMNHFARDFDSELFMPPLEPHGVKQSAGDFATMAASQLARQYDEWTASPRPPGLFQDLFLTTSREPGSVGLLQFDPKSRKLVPIEWPQEFLRFRDFCVGESRSVGAERTYRFSEIPGMEDIPAVVHPFILPAVLFEGGVGAGVPARFAGPPEWEIIRINRKSFQKFLSRLVEENFPRNGDFDYDIFIVQKDSNRLIYASRDMDAADLQKAADASLVLSVPGGVSFSTRRVLPGEAPAAIRVSGPMLQPPGTGVIPAPGMLQVLSVGQSESYQASPRGWQLYARHHSGSLDSFASQFRARNLAISSVAFLLLALGLVFTFASSQRIRAIGKLQLEFAAGLSHELRTPLAVLRSAGYHLVHGNIAGREDVVRYGTMIQQEGRRLSEMVEQALLFAQTQSSRYRYQRDAVEISHVIEEAIASCREMLSKSSRSIVSNISPDLPIALTDENALAHCIRNLLVNAVKYSEDGGRVEVSAQGFQARGAELEVSITNSGRAIDPADLPHIFEPFFRGKNAVGIAGNGLGLYMVESILKSLGGRIRVTSTAGKTRFDIYIPASEPSKMIHEV